MIINTWLPKWLSGQLKVCQTNEKNQALVINLPAATTPFGCRTRKPESADADGDDKASDAEKTDDSMMAGVVPGAKKDDAKKMLPVTPWGRYLKTLLSSSEFMFIN